MDCYVSETNKVQDVTTAVGGEIDMLCEIEALQQ